MKPVHHKADPKKSAGRPMCFRTALSGEVVTAVDAEVTCCFCLAALEAESRDER